jgi:gas vesicle protein
MSQRDNFSGGFLLGVIVGSVVGGIAGAVFASKRFDEEILDAAPADPNLAEAKAAKAKSRSLRPTSEKEVEAARRSLEDKIAQLNEAIDDVRQQLGHVNGNRADQQTERSFIKED